MKTLKKITTKAVLGKVTVGSALRVIGFVDRIEHMETPYGDSLRLKGEFEAINISTGEGFRSFNAFLPDIVTDQIEAALAASEGRVEFGVDIHADEDNSVNTGYVYSATNLLPPAADNPLEKIKKALPKLPVPQAIAQDNR